MIASLSRTLTGTPMAQVEILTGCILALLLLLLLMLTPRFPLQGSPWNPPHLNRSSCVEP